MAQQIAIYGKGGSGKTTIAANLAAALAETGQRVLLVGCSPTADSSHLLLGEVLPVTIASYVQAAVKPAAAALIASGYRGIGCIEVGDLHGSDSCTARSVVTALQLLDELEVVERFAPDFVIHDLPGEPGCVGAIMPQAFADGLSLLVTAANFQSLYATNRYIGDLCRSSRRSIALVANGSSSSFEAAFVADFALQVGLPVAAAISNSMAVRHSELYGKTVIEAGPLSNHAYGYRRLAKLVSEGRSPAKGSAQAVPLDAARLKAWAREWGQRLGELEFGIVADGSGI